MSRPSLAVIGSGIAGLGAAWLLHRHFDLRVFEAEPRIGGHSNTVTVHDGHNELPVDTGFIVFNPVNYPNLTTLFERLDVPTAATDMSFAVSVDHGRLEYSGTNLAGLFAQPRNLVRPAFHRMLVDIVRFNRAARALARDSTLGAEMPLGDFLDALRVGHAMRDHYLLPMAAAIWSCSTAAMLDFPARSLARFFDNHGLLNINDRPQWHTVRGGSRAYIERLTAPFADCIERGDRVVSVQPGRGGVMVRTESGRRSRFDHVVIAAHADQALEMLSTPSDRQRALLSRFRYQSNRAVLHRDARLMPRRRRVWSSWNYLRDGQHQRADAVSVTYWMNALQPLATRQDYFVSLNPLDEPAERLTDAEFEYMHPVFDAQAVAAQAALREIQGEGNVWLCGSYFGYGFHEDGLSSALEVAARLGVDAPWNVAGSRRAVAVDGHAAALPSAPRGLSKAA